VLIKRYKRFLADVELDAGGKVTAFTPNTGSLLSCALPGSRVWLTWVPGDKRKYNWQWLLVKPQRALVCVDTGIPNKVVAEFARRQKIPQLAGYREYISEMPLVPGTRADLCCRVHEDDMLGRCWVEVKSTTLVRGRVAQFPDAVTSRGSKHLIELAKAVAAGSRALQVYFVQRGDCDVFRPADDIDPEYGRQLRHAVSAGVEVAALQARVTTRAITIKRQLRVEL
jgi:sugar fermentation stimulation protein A